ncbi:MAG: ssDNA-binding protein [Pirellulales bacterium]
MAKKPANIVLIPRARLVTFHGVATKVKYNPTTKKSEPNPEGKYPATLLIPKSDNLDSIRAAIKTAIEAEASSVPWEQWEKFLKDGNKIIEKTLKKNPEKSADRLEFYKDQWVLEVSSQNPPSFSIPEGGRAKVLEDAALVQRTFYSGCYVAAEINVVANRVDSGRDDPNTGDDIYNHYVNGYHNMLLKVGDGDRFGRRDANDVFKNLLGGKTQNNPTTGTEEF